MPVWGLLTLAPHQEVTPVTQDKDAEEAQRESARVLSAAAQVAASAGA